MPVNNSKNSLSFLKFVYRTGEPDRKMWALKELSDRWRELKADAQLEMNLDNFPP